MLRQLDQGLENKKTFEPCQFGDIGGNIGRQVTPVISHPVYDALVIDVKLSAYLAHGMTFQVQLQGLETDFFFVSLLFGDGSVPAPTRGTPIALAAGRRPSIARLLRVFVASWTKGAKYGHRSYTRVTRRARINKARATKAINQLACSASIKPTGPAGRPPRPNKAWANCSMV